MKNSLNQLCTESLSLQWCKHSQAPPQHATDYGTVRLAWTVSHSPSVTNPSQWHHTEDTTVSAAFFIFDNPV